MVSIGLNMFRNLIWVKQLGWGIRDPQIIKNNWYTKWFSKLGWCSIYNCFCIWKIFIMCKWYSFCPYGATVGKSFLIKETPYKAVYASYLIRIRLLNGIDASFIYQFFNSACYWAQITDKSVDVVQPNCNGTALQELFIPLPYTRHSLYCRDFLQPSGSCSECLRSTQLQTAYLLSQTR